GGSEARCTSPRTIMVEHAAFSPASVQTTSSVEGDRSCGRYVNRVKGSASRTLLKVDLQNGLKAFLGTATIVAGDYEQLRLIVTGATITLKTGFTFSDGTSTHDLKLPSGQQ